MLDIVDEYDRETETREAVHRWMVDDSPVLSRDVFVATKDFRLLRAATSTRNQKTVYAFAVRSDANKDVSDVLRFYVSDNTISTRVGQWVAVPSGGQCVRVC